MKEVETNFYWDYPWKLFTFGNFNKYPNDFATHVVSVDVIQRNLTPEGLLVTDRLLQLKQPIPSILRRIGLPLPETSYFLERSIINPQTQHYEATSYNLSMRSFFQAIEICSVKADPEKGGTQFTQKARFTACSYFSRLVEDAAVSRFESNALKGRAGMQSVLKKLEDELEWFSREVKVHVNQVKAQLDNLERGIETRLESIESDMKKQTKHIFKQVWPGFSPLVKELDSSCSGRWYSRIHNNPFS